MIYLIFIKYLGSCKWFETEKNKVLNGLKEVFFEEHKNVEDRRKQINRNVFIFKHFTRVFVVKHILSYLTIDDILNLTGVWIYFNSLIKSSFFIRYMSKLKERTEIVIDPKIFIKYAGDEPKELIASRYSHLQCDKKELNEEDITAQLEILTNVKEFLNIKLQRNDGTAVQLENDIKTLRNLLRIEKGINQKQNVKILGLESSLQSGREQHFKQSSEMFDSISDLEGNIYKKQKELEHISNKFKNAKEQKKMLKEEVKMLMDSVKSMEEKWRNMESMADDVTEYLESYGIKKMELIGKNKDI